MNKKQLIAEKKRLDKITLDLLIRIDQTRATIELLRSQIKMDKRSLATELLNWRDINNELRKLK